MCTNVQSEFRLFIMLDYESIRFSKNMTNTFMVPINIPFSLFFLVALVTFVF